jgi:DNA-binding MarR family transcriptional regulator
MTMGLLGFASAERGAAPSPSEPAPSGFPLPGRHVGDRGTIVLSDGAARVGFEWLPDADVRDTQGYLHRSGTLRLDVQGERPYTNLQYYDLLTFHHLLTRGGAPQEYSDTWQPVPGLPIATTDSRRLGFEFGAYDPSDPVSRGFAPCGFLHPLQGATVPLHGEAFRLGDCRLGDELVLDYAFRYAGRDDVGGHLAYRYVRSPSAEDGGAYHYEGSYHDADLVLGRGSTVSLWLSPDAPYPVRIRLEDSSLRYDLADFTAGTSTQGPATAPHDPLPALELAPREVWGPSEAGLHHPFPLSAAFQKARDDPFFSGVRDFVAAHPSASIVIARYHEDETSGEQVRLWDFTLGEGARSVGACVAQYTSQPGEGILPPTGVPASVTRYQTRDCSWDALERPIEVPNELPTVVSLMHRWELVAPPDRVAKGANAWGFDLRRPGSIYGHEGLVEAGYVHSRWDGNFVQGSVQNEEEFLVGNEPSGALIATRSLEATYTSSTGLSSPPAEREPVPRPMHPSSLGIASVARWPPGSVAGAVVAGAATSVGLTAWFWPAQRTGLLAPLFSRLQRPRALDHRLRNDLMALVEQQPGIHVLEMCRRLGRPRGTVQHHVRKLEQLGLLVTHAAHGYVCCYPRRGAAERQAATDALLKSDATRRVLAAVVAAPGRTGTQLADELGLTRQTLHHHVSRLRQAGLVVADEAAGRVLRLRPSDGASALLARCG